MIRRLGLLAMLASAGMVAAGDDPFAFMPEGGRDLLARVFLEPADRDAALAEDRTAEDWQADIAARAPDLGDKEVATLAFYLAEVAPFEGEELPADGRELSLNQCQSCHSLFTGYLMQRRDREGWLSTFASPFHTVIEMTDQEKAIFAGYSAINMPMNVQDVPPELRF